MNARAGSLTLSRAIYGRGLVSMQQCDVYNVVVSLQTLYMMYAYIIVFSLTLRTCEVRRRSKTGQEVPNKQ